MLDAAKIPDIQIATSDHREALMDLMITMHRENGVAPLYVPKMSDNLDRALARDGAVIGIIGNRKFIKAAIGIVIHAYWYSIEPHIEDYFNFVRQEYRKSNYADQLINFSMQYSDTLKIPLLMGIVTKDRTEAKIRLYERKFGKMAGAVFFYPKLPDYSIEEAK